MGGRITRNTCFEEDRSIVAYQDPIQNCIRFGVVVSAKWVPCRGDREIILSGIGKESIAFPHAALAEMGAELLTPQEFFERINELSREYVALCRMMRRMNKELKSMNDLLAGQGV